MAMSLLFPRVVCSSFDGAWKCDFDISNDAIIPCPHTLSLTKLLEMQLVKMQARWRALHPPDNSFKANAQK